MRPPESCRRQSRSYGNTRCLLRDAYSAARLEIANDDVGVRTEAVVVERHLMQLLDHAAEQHRDAGIVTELIGEPDILGHEAEAEGAAEHAVERALQGPFGRGIASGALLQNLCAQLRIEA